MARLLKHRKTKRYGRQPERHAVIIKTAEPSPGWSKKIHRGVKEFEPWGILLAIFGLAFAIHIYSVERNDRQEDRAVRNAALFTQIAELSISDPKRSGFAVAEIVRFLSDQEVPIAKLVLTGVHFPKETDFSSIDFSEVDLSRVKLSYSKLSGSAFFKTNLSNSILLGAQLQNADLASTNLEGADLSQASLVGADLWNTNLSGANLESADMTNATIRLTDFNGVNVKNVDFREADLSGFYVQTGLVVDGADFSGSNISQTQIDDACQAIDGVPPLLPSGLIWHGRVCERYQTD